MNKILNYIPKLVVVFLLIVSGNCMAGGFSSWCEKTPYGHQLDHDGYSDGIITINFHPPLISFKYFYFYKGHIIAHGDSTYYIINEKTESVQEFSNREEWKKEISKQKLKPIWKREYDSSYSSAFGRLFPFLLFFLPFPFALPLLWLICLISLLFSTHTFIGFRKHFSWVYPSIIFLVWLFDIFPQSI